MNSIIRSNRIEDVDKKVDMKPIIYKEMQGPSAKVEFTKKNSDCIIQLFLKTPRAYTKRDALNIIMILEKLVPRSIKCKIIPPSKNAEQYTIELKKFFDMLGNHDRQVEKIAYNLGRIVFK